MKNRSRIKVIVGASIGLLLVTASAASATNPPNVAPTSTGFGNHCSFDNTAGGSSSINSGNGADDPTCIAGALQDFNAARAADGLGPQILPSNWTSLTIPQQLFVLANIDRIDRGLDAITGLNSSMNTAAQGGADAKADPSWTGTFSQWGSNWAGTVNPLWSEYLWMYYDGYSTDGTTTTYGWNGDCTSPTNMGGCWGHRNNILVSDSNPPLLMGAAYDAASTTTPGTAEIFIQGSGLNADAFTWTGEAPHLPTTSGSAGQGQTLTINPGTLASGTTASYQWKRNGSNIPSATNGTYVVSSADSGTTLSATITYTTASVAWTETLANWQIPSLPPIAPGAPPTVTGTGAVGDMLTVTPGTTTPTATSTNYQWFRGPSAIAGAVNNTYTLIPADANTHISVQVTYHASGYSDLVRTADGPHNVAPGTLAIGAAPTVTGKAAVGNVLIATAPQSTPAGTINYQWRRNGTAIAGATNPTNMLTPADLGTQITVVATYTATGYATQSGPSSAPTTAVAPGTFVSTHGASVTGRRVITQVLTAVPQRLSPTASRITYVWMRNGRAIRGATGSRYRLTKADRHTTITVRITYTRTAYTTIVQQLLASKRIP